MFMKTVRSCKRLVIAVFLVLGISSASLAAGSIVFGDFSWDSVQVHNRIAGFILEHGYGYNVTYKFGESIPLILGLRRGDVDATMEVWVDNVYDAIVDALREGDVIALGCNYADAPQGWYVPTYVIEGDEARGIKPMAPDLKSVLDLPKYVELFSEPQSRGKGVFYNAPTGWVAHDINNAKLAAYGLDKYFSSFDTGSDAGLSSVIIRHYQRGEPVLAYNWEPNWIMGLLDMTRLEEPPYSEARWRADFGTAYPAANVRILVNRDFPGREPEAASVLANYSTELEHNNAFLAYMQENDASADEAARWFLKEYPEVWTRWIIDQDVIAKVAAALEQ
jgi:glycine betaine/proline transport system substrate-binding protein